MTTVIYSKFSFFPVYPETATPEPDGCAAVVANFIAVVVAAVTAAVFGYM